MAMANQAEYKAGPEERQDTGKGKLGRIVITEKLTENARRRQETQAEANGTTLL